MASPIPVWQGTVDKDAVLRLDARTLFSVYLKKFRNQPVQVIVKKLARKKSRNQLGYLFGVVYPVLADHVGYRDYEVEEVHDAVMRILRGLKPAPNPLGLRVSLAEMEHEQVSEYIEDVRHWALVNHGCVTPDAEKAVAA